MGRAALVAAAIAASLQPETEEDVLDDADFGASPQQMDEETADQHQLPIAFVQQAHEPLGANGLIFALLMSADPEVEQKQLALITASKVTGLPELVYTLSRGVRELELSQRLPLLEMCLPALKVFSLPQYRRFKNTLMQIIQADARTDLYEWCLFQLVRHYLDPEFIRVKPSRARHRTLAKVKAHLQMVLSVLAHEGSGEEIKVFQLAAEELGLASDLSLLPREQCSVVAFSKAVHALADCYPLLKPRVLKAMALAAGDDGRFSGPEREIIASMAAVMDCPVPSVMPPP